MSSPSSAVPPPKDSAGSRSLSGTHPGQLPVQPERDYSGAWLGDDGGWYFIRQFDTDLWWVGASAGGLCPGLEFCNVYHASVDGPDITGDWSDVPRGGTSNRGTLTLAFGDDNLLHKVNDTGGFGASTWQPRSGPPWWPFISVAEAFQHTLKNVVGNWDVTEKQTLAENLLPLKAPVTVFAWITQDDDHPATKPVYVTYANDSNSPQQSFTYNEFICLNQPSFFGAGQQNDCDATFMMAADTGQITQRQPFFFDGVGADKDNVTYKLTGSDVGGFEGEIIMFGRSADCNDEGAETSPAIFPGWAERTDSSVLFNGKPISIANFLTEISVRDPVRVTGALIFDHGHGEDPGDNPQKLEIHPVYSVDKITSTFSGLSGAWADDVGNTYYLRHDPTDNTVWYLGLSPLNSTAFAQVFRGTFYPAPTSKYSAIPEAVPEDSTVPARNPAFPVTPQNVLTGDAVAIDLGWGTAPPFEASRTRLGDTGPVTFEFGVAADLGPASGDLTGGNIPELSMGDFRLIKLYDA
jgi:hypothetical protein